MIKQFVEAWGKNKGELKEYFKTTPQREYGSYEDLVRLLFEIVINPYLGDYRQFKTSDIEVIDDGDYQGTQIFILHRDTYQPSVNEYVYTHTYYGSCSGCDTLQSIQSWDFNKIPDEEQVKDYMELCLHLLQKCKCFTED